MKVLIMSADEFEDLELLYPYYRLKEAGHEVDIASMVAGDIVGKHGIVARAGLDFKGVDPEEYDALVIPGGRAPERVRTDETALKLVRRFFERGKPVAAICHGPQILVSAGVVKGKKATCYRSVTEELKRAGAKYVDAEVVVDGNLITSRFPDDLPAFARELLRKL